MTDPNSNPNPNQDPKDPKGGDNQDPKDQNIKPGDGNNNEEPKVPRSHVEKISKELKELKDKEAKRLEQEALKKGEHEKVITEKEKRIAELEAELSKRDLTSKTEKALKDANVDPEVSDMVTEYVMNQAAAQEKPVEKIISDLVKAKPGLFTGKKSAGRSGFGGQTNSGSDLGSQSDNQSLGDYIKSTQSQ